MTQVIINNVDPTQTMEIVRELRNQGLVQGIDFDFAYHQATYNNDGFIPVAPRHANFMFYKEVHASWFSLKYHQ